MHINRYYKNLDKLLKPNKVILIYGPRQIGKTTLVQEFLQSTKLKYKKDTGDNLATREWLGSQSLEKIKDYVGDNKLIFIDEAQKIPNIGIGLKIMMDNIPGIKIIATGSSSFELAGQVGEPLTGRKFTYSLFPIAQLELKNHYSPYELKSNLAKYLVFGTYPDVINAETEADKGKYLDELVNSYLLKDILELEKVKDTKLLRDLLRLLAFQIGSEVSHTELGTQLGIDSKTVSRYLDLFEKSFIIYNLRGFSRNLRKEITKKGKYYFYDTGVRNALISNFNQLDHRDDQGKLWENFLFMERLKKRSYTQIYANDYFWRTWDQKEIDLIEERDGKLFGYEFKFGNKKTKNPTEWLQTYKEAEFHVINQDNYLDFIT